MSEKSPNPHGESNILEMPIRTQQHNETSGRNIPKVPEYGWRQHESLSGP